MWNCLDNLWCPFVAGLKGPAEKVEVKGNGDGVMMGVFAAD